MFHVGCYSASAQCEDCGTWRHYWKGWSYNSWHCSTWTQGKYSLLWSYFLKNVSLSQVGRGFKIFSLKIEGGILYLTSRSALVPCSTDDWIDLSKVKCEANNIITSQDLLKLENQSHVSSTLFVKVCNNKYSEYKLLILGLWCATNQNCKGRKTQNSKDSCKFTI